MTISERENLIELFETYQNLLTQTQKQAFHLHYLEDLSFSEISEILATTRSAVHDAVKKAIKKLLDIESKLQ